MIDAAVIFAAWWFFWVGIIITACRGTSTPARDRAVYILFAWAAPVALAAMWLWSKIRKVWK